MVYIAQEVVQVAVCIGGCNNGIVAFQQIVVARGKDSCVAGTETPYELDAVTHVSVDFLDFLQYNGVLILLQFLFHCYFLHVMLFWDLPLKMAGAFVAAIFKGGRLKPPAPLCVAV